VGFDAAGELRLAGGAHPPRFRLGVLLDGHGWLDLH
jgi:hypothetical protein